MIKLLPIFIIAILFSYSSFSKVDQSRITKQSSSKFNKKSLNMKILTKFSSSLTKKELKELKGIILSNGGKSVPSLIKIMKSNKFPDKNRWVATFLVGKIMGKKSGPYLTKFLKHPNWVLRMASLKTLLALREKRYAKHYVSSLKDKSFLVRAQALDNIRSLNLKQEAASVWSMLYDKRNYYNSKKSSLNKRTNIIKTVIKTVGDLKFEKARKPLFSMIKNKKYNDIFSEMDYSLAQITGKKSPKGSKTVKRNYWHKISLSYTII